MVLLPGIASMTKQPPDASCNICAARIQPTESRYRCSCNACDDMHLCVSCGSHTCPLCGRSKQVYVDRASPFVLRTRIFREGFAPAVADAGVVHPFVMVARAFRVYGERPLLGEPAHDGSVHWWSYACCGQAAHSLAQLLHAACTQSGAHADAAVVICAPNGVGWLLADWACALAAVPSIVIDASTPPTRALSTARAAARRVGRDVCAAVVAEEYMAEWEEAAIREGKPNIDTVAGAAGVSLFTTADARRRLVRLHADDVSMHEADGAAEVDTAAVSAGEGTDLVTCLFSFGSTGEPKPLWFDALRWAEWGERNPPSSKRARAALARRSVRVSCAALFAPLSHGLARRTAWGELLHGGRLGLCDPRGRMADAAHGSTEPDACVDLLEQIRSFAPTTLSAAPRFYALYQRRFETILARAVRNADGDAARLAALMAVRELGGERLRLLAVGGAVVPLAQMAFLRECFGHGGRGGGRAAVSNGYGMAEVPGGIARDGVPLPGVQVRLQARAAADAVEERERWDDGVGEILVKTTRGIIVGSDGAAAVDADGWFHTGDLGRWTEHDGSRRLEVIDRVGFAVKLANGEYFAPQHAEGVYEDACPTVASCVLFARVGDVAPTAVVVPRVSSLHEDSAGADGLEANRVAGAVLAEMRAAAVAGGLRGWEVPSRVVIDLGPWDEASGCCSAHGKVRRHVIARRNALLPIDGSGSGAHDGKAGDDRYGGVGHQLAGAVDSDGERTILQVIGFLSAPTDAQAAAHFSAVNSVGDDTNWWTALGGDSISATELLAGWEAEEGRLRVEHAQPAGTPGLSVHDIFSMTLWQLRRKAQARLGRVQSAADIGGPSGGGSSDGGAERTAAFWECEAAVSTATDARAATAVAAPDSDIPPMGGDTTNGGEGGPCVLLTGGTGFLGPHLLTALLATTTPRRWETLCVLTRHPVDRVVRHPAVVAAAAASGCRVLGIGADLNEAGLGLSPSDRATLRSMRIDAIVHSAAMVDHARSYDTLHGVNVAAASRLVQLLTAPRGDAPLRPPPTFVLVSTMSVIPVAEAGVPAGWSGRADELVPPACATALESGYAQSKLVAEHHLAAAASAGLIRLIVARLGLLGPCMSGSGDGVDGAQYDDQDSTRRDWLSLLLCAVTATGSSPAGLTSGGRSVAVLPVNMAAAALASRAAECSYGEVRGEVRGDDTDVAVVEGDKAVQVVNLDAAAFGLAPRQLSALLDDIEKARGRRLRRELPYPIWRREVAAAGGSAVLALAMLPPEAKGGTLRLPSGARRRLRDASRMLLAQAGTLDAALAAVECPPCEEAYDPTVDNRSRKTSPLATTAFAFIEAKDEPCHVTILLTQWLRVMRLCKVGSAHPVPTEWHRHRVDSLYLFLADAAIYVQDHKQAAPVLTQTQAEKAFYAPHSTSPLIHQGARLTQKSTFTLF